MQLLIYCGTGLAAAVCTALCCELAPLMILPLFLGFSVGVIALHFLVLLIGSFFLPKDRTSERTNLFQRYIMLSTLSLILTAVRARVKVRGRELLPKEPFVFVSNHYSVFDPMIAMLYLRKHRLSFVSKKENIQIPVAGRYMLAYGCVSLDRGSSRKAVEVINNAAENVTERGRSMGIYPEGGTNRDPENVLLKPFKNGAFRLVTKTGAPIVVAVMSNTRKINRQPITNVTMDIIRVFTYDEYKDMRTAELSDLIYHTMEEWMSKR